MTIAERKQEVEQTFANIQTSINLIKEELAKYEVATLNDLEIELIRIQGEYRGLTKLEEAEPSVSVKGEAKKENK